MYQRLFCVMIASGLAAGVAGCNASAPPTSSAPPPARTAPSVADLVDARGSSGEMELEKRGYSSARTRGLTTYWWHPAGACVRVVTSQGRYKTVQETAAADCGKAAAASATPAGAPAAAPAQTVSKAMPTPDEQACLQAVNAKTNNPDVVLLTGTETSEANTAVYIGVGPQHAKWRCLVSKGRVAEVMSMTNEGKM